jgi:hypothetical protein
MWWVLPVPGRAEQDDASLPAKKSSWTRCRTSVWRIEVWNGEVELLNRLAPGLGSRLAAVHVAAVDLGLEQRGAKALVAPILLASAVGELGQRPGRAGALSARKSWASSASGRVMRSAGHRRPASEPRPGAGAPLALKALLFEPAGVLERGDRPLLGKRTRVMAGELAGVQGDREVLAVADADLDLASDQRLRAAGGERARANADPGPVAPPATFMRAWPPTACRGGLGSLVAYASRPLWLVLRAPAGLRLGGRSPEHQALTSAGAAAPRPIFPGRRGPLRPRERRVLRWRHRR